MKVKMVLDGEIIAMKDNGQPDFQLLQYAAKDPDTAIAYQAFDLLEFDGKDITDLSLIERKKLLRDSLPKSDHIRYCDHVVAKGKEFFNEVQAKHLEGVIAKRMDGIYSAGLRSRSWLKIKDHRTQEVVVGGWTAPRSSRKYFGALLLGVYKDGKLQYVGHTGTGFDDRMLKDLASTMATLERKTSPFTGKVEANEAANWVTPKLVATIKFTEWTRDGRMRHPVFVGLRSDKDAKEVRRESQKQIDQASSR